ncbi:hypothetical protein LEP1GSC125_3890 [Leptospira mayottensis 200901122]|uniref:Uncharacterized protein n=1 Tax=Leptospira mayottensis 200901122 TaxID=1193010 RepID=A0AA87MM24_9LEPT|nr:hypothetical protein LEP1GSC125_3890 [Leptospira mayottensis 200901122]
MLGMLKPIDKFHLRKAERNEIMNLYEKAPIRNIPINF